MKRVQAWLILAALAACSSPEEFNDTVGLTHSQESVAAPVGAAPDRRHDQGAKVAPVDFKDTEKDGEATRDFTYSWPSEVSFITPLVTLLSERRNKALAEQKSEWREAVAEFGNGTGEGSCFSCVNRGYGMEWKVVTDTPRFLSLSAERYLYTGGAHGNSDFDALVWDREANRGAGEALYPLALFASEEALQNAVRGPYCDALIEQQVDRRAGVEMSAEAMLAACPQVDELTIVLGSSSGVTFDRIGLLAAPYIAGPYAEGAYEVTVPVTKALVEAVKPEYREAFAITR